MTDGPIRRLLGIVRRVADADAAGPLSDDRLLDRFRTRGDEAAFEVLVWRHGAMVLATCRRVLGDAHAAEDAFQATFLILARKARSVRRGGALAGWLHRVALRVAGRAKQSAARRAWHERRAAIATVTGPPDGPASELRAVLDEELNRLPAKLRLPVVLCYLEGQTTAEAARQLGCPRGTVLSRLATARERLRVRLLRRGVALPAGGLALAGPAEAPAALVTVTVRAAVLFAAGRAVAGVASTEVIAMTEGALRAMVLSKVKLTAAVVLAFGVLGTGAGLVAWPTAGPGPAFAEGPQAKAEEPKRPAADPEQDAIKRAKQAQELEDRLSKLEAVRDAEEQEELRRVVEARLEATTAEERFRKMQGDNPAQDRAEIQRMSVYEEAIKRSKDQRQKLVPRAPVRYV